MDDHSPSFTLSSLFFLHYHPWNCRSLTITSLIDRYRFDTNLKKTCLTKYTGTYTTYLFVSRDSRENHHLRTLAIDLINVCYALHDQLIILWHRRVSISLLITRPFTFMVKHLLLYYVIISYVLCEPA
ncbi:uncharacterized protein LOC143183278 [Calliopsis andreniformis]|uniref:uncharacterized protein LOC143183278 n=1 Tax=Calliopsis andreniformis TaxID=337506 RepID=UPI003FCDAFDF